MWIRVLSSCPWGKIPPQEKWSQIVQKEKNVLPKIWSSWLSTPNFAEVIWRTFFSLKSVMLKRMLLLGVGVHMGARGIQPCCMLDESKEERTCFSMAPPPGKYWKWELVKVSDGIRASLGCFKVNDIEFVVSTVRHTIGLGETMGNQWLCRWTNKMIQIHTNPSTFKWFKWS